MQLSLVTILSELS